MRLVIAAAALMASSPSVAVAPPPPPPPLSDSVPAEIGGYATGWMYGAYRHWLRREANDFGLAALEQAAPKRAEDSGAQPIFALREGPKISFFVSLGDGVDRYAFHLVCPRSSDMPSPALVSFQDYLESVRPRCAWQVSRVRIRFRETERELGEEALLPDFVRLAGLLKQAGVPADGRTQVPDEIFTALGTHVPLFQQATRLATSNAVECSAITSVLAHLDRQQVRLDIGYVAADRSTVTPPIESSSFRIEIPILQGGNGFGTLTLTDDGSGLASEAWQAMRDRIEPCLDKVSSAVSRAPNPESSTRVGG